MIRRIVLIRSHEWLEAGWAARSFAPSGSLLAGNIKVPGMEFDESYHPVRVASRAVPAEARPTAAGFNYAAAPAVATYAVRTEFEDEDAVERLRHDRASDVVGVYSDPTISPFPSPYCGSAPVGKTGSVRNALGVRALRWRGLTGSNVRVAVVDTGIDGALIPVAGGWSPVPGRQPGSTVPAAHGTMVAYDVRIAAPDAKILDYALLQSRGSTWSAFLSDAIAAFVDLMGLLAREPGPLVVNNSWGLFDRTEDAPIGSPDNYSANLEHPFNQTVAGLVAAGADVFFAAGNCGGDCPDRRCGFGDTGPGASIHGANSHPDVITVAAVTVKRQRLGYSSQGPGGLYSRKPDIAAPSHFAGSGVYDVDGGTSAASPVAAGVAAAIRQQISTTTLSPAQLKGVLQRTARDVNGNGWDTDIGYGVISAGAVVRALRIQP